MVTNQEDIVNTMQDWYQSTANSSHSQAMTLTDFLAKHEIQLPQISDSDLNMLESPFAPEELQTAIKAVHENSASGPSGQSIALFKLLFIEIPSLMTAAINQLAFIPELASLPEFQWIEVI